MAIYWLGDDAVPTCDVTGTPADECDHVDVEAYDEFDEWDLMDKQAREEADRA